MTNRQIMGIMLDAGITGLAAHNYMNAPSYGWAVLHGTFMILGAIVLLRDMIRANTPPPAGA